MVLMAFALGLAGVYLWNGLSIGTGEVYVDIPAVTSSENDMVIFPANDVESGLFNSTGSSDYTAQKRSAIGDRDISLYDISEVANVCLDDPTFRNCMGKRQAARRFILDHLTRNRRGYSEIHMPCIDCAPVYHVFIEPDQSGRWRFVLTLATKGPGSTVTGHIVKFRRPNSNERYSNNPGKVLSFLDDAGKEIGSF